MLIMLIIVVIIIISSIVIYFALKPLEYWKKKGVKQKSLWHCLSVNWFTMFKRQSVVKTVMDFYEEFPKSRYSGSYLFNTPTLTLRDPELIKQITIKDFEYFVDRKIYIPEDIDPLMGKNIGSLTGEKWKHIRCTLSPAFTTSKMKTMFVLIQECSQNFVDHFLKQDNDIISIQFKDIFTRFCADAIGSIAFGISVNSLDQKNNDFYVLGRSITDLTKFTKMFKFFGYLMAPKLYKLLNIKFTTKEEDTFFRELINDTIRAREEKGIIRPDMIHLLLQTRKGIKIDQDNSAGETGFAAVQEEKSGKGSRLTNLTNEDITAQPFVFFFAGFESVSTLFCFMAYELAVNQDIQEKLRNEINQTNEKCKGTLTYDTLVGMKYMDMVLSEVLRKWPPQAAAERICTKSYILQPLTTEESTVHIEPGTNLIIPTFGIHRDPQYFPDPERFDPERFSSKNKDKILPYTYIPFGAGPRNCIGSRLALLEAKVLFFYLLINFDIVPVKKTSIPVRLTKSPALVSIEGGCWLGLKRIMI